MTDILAASPTLACVATPSGGCCMTIVLSCVFGSEVDPDLATKDQGIVDFSCSTRPNDILNIRLEEGGALAEIKSVGPFQNRFVVLNPHGWIEQLLALLCLPQVA